MHIAWKKRISGSSPNAPCTGQCNAQVKSRQVPEHGDELLPWNALQLCLCPKSDRVLQIQRWEH